TVIQLHSKLCTRQGLNDHTLGTNFIFFFCHIASFYSPSLVKVRRLIRRIAFFFSMRRCSLLETNQRLRRTVLKTPLLTTFLRKRLRSESWDSPLRKFTDAITGHLLSAWICREMKIGRYADSAEDVLHKKRQNDRWIRPYASHSSLLRSGDIMLPCQTA